MPIYCEILQLVLPKTIVEAKYNGGLDKFKTDFQWGKTVDHEDGELIAVGSMDNSFPIPEGLHYDDVTETSRDFVIVARYGTRALSWDVNWCDTNRVFIWHKDCKPSAYEKMAEIAEMMTVGEIQRAIEKGENPFQSIY